MSRCNNTFGSGKCDQTARRLALLSLASSDSPLLADAGPGERRAGVTNAWASGAFIATRSFHSARVSTHARTPTWQRNPNVSNVNIPESRQDGRRRIRSKNSSLTLLANAPHGRRGFYRPHRENKLGHVPLQGRASPWRGTKGSEAYVKNGARISERKSAATTRNMQMEGKF